jgi:Grx4 family monothiol glutaredoxin
MQPVRSTTAPYVYDQAVVHKISIIVCTFCFQTNLQLSQVVRILHAQGVDFSSVNILDYPAIREGVKKFSDWPTIPQVYVNGEFIGGCDIVTQQHKSGELAQLFKDAGLLSTEPPTKSAADSA